MAIRILLANNQIVVRQGLRMFLSLDSELEIVGEASNGHEAIALALTLQTDVILMDLVMPQMGGIEATARLREMKTSSAIIALSNRYDLNLIHAAIKVGVDTYLSNYIQPEVLIATIKRLNMGHIVLPDAPMKSLLCAIGERRYDAIDEEDMTLMKLLAKQSSIQEIANQLNQTPEAIEQSMIRLQQKLALSSRLLLMLHAIKATSALKSD